MALRILRRLRPGSFLEDRGLRAAPPARELWRRSRAALRAGDVFDRQAHGSVRWQVRRGLQDPGLFALLADPDAAFGAPTRVFKQEPVSQVVQTGGFVIKRIEPKRRRNRWIERLRTPRVLRAFRAAYLLDLLGVPTARGMAAGIRLEKGLVIRSYLIHELLPDTVHIDIALRSADPERRRHLITRAAALIGSIHRNGLSNRDLKAGNVLVDRRDGLHLIDLDGLRWRGRVRPERAARDLERLFRDLRARAELRPEEEADLREQHRLAMFAATGDAEPSPHLP